ncbi:MAG: precorrin-8X methylmutase [Gemmatales bacterium]|nr:MAG: precorrin-8X methylmutase [Gemmatales bacterium]
MTPDEITAESFRIIEQEVGQHPFNEWEWPIARRMIHASGDVSLVHDLRFTHDAARVGIRALQQQTPIVTDGRMTATGIDRRLTACLNVQVACFIDAEDVRQQAVQEQKTRSACGMEKAIASIGTAIYVIGSAPTALLTVCDAVLHCKLKPALILALPVGFVSVVESKQQALALPVPVISVAGRKGGSAMAAAATNALLHLAVEDAGRIG